MAALSSRSCPNCKTPMEPGYLWGQNGWLNWTPPKMTPEGPKFSGWKSYELVYTRKHVFRPLIPLTYRCKECRIYWIGSDESASLSDMPLSSE